MLEFNEDNAILEHKGYGIRATNSGLYAIVTLKKAGVLPADLRDGGLFTGPEGAQRLIDQHVNTRADKAEKPARAK